MEYPDTLAARVDRALEEKGAVDLAQLFHETYERLAPQFNYQTRKASAVPWEKVPRNNKKLMIAVCAEIIDKKGWQELQQELSLLRELVQDYYTEMAIGKQLEDAPGEAVYEWEQRIEVLQKRAEAWMLSEAEAARVHIPVDVTTASGRL